MTLRAYQAQAVEWTERTWQALRAAGKRASVVLQAPTGAGKTVILDALRPDLVIAPGVDLCRQLRGRVEGAEVHTTTGLAKRLRDGRPLPSARRVAVDEARWVCAAGSSAVVEWYLGQGAEIVLVDATPATAGGVGLGRWADALYQVASVRELVEAGWLVPTRVLAPCEAQQELAARPVDAWLRYTPGETAIAFCEDKAHARRSAAEFVAARVACEVITDDTPEGQRAAMLSRFATGETTVLVNAQILRQGIDEPRVSSIILGRAVQSLPLYLQAVGRGGRPAPGKSLCTVLDLRGCSHQHGLPDDPRVWNLEGTACRPALEALPPCVECRNCHSWGRGGTCVFCGFALPPPPPPKVLARDLVEIHRAEPEEKKRDTLLRFVRDAYRAAISRGKKGAEADRSAWAGAHRWEGKYLIKPKPRDVLAAIKAARQEHDDRTTETSSHGQE